MLYLERVIARLKSQQDRDIWKTLFEFFDEAS
jgi:hypothetical protein